MLQPRLKENQFVLLIDIALDPFPCNGGTNQLRYDKKKKKNRVVRAGAQLECVPDGCNDPDECRAARINCLKNTDEYIKIATELASDRDRLRRLRHGLREGRKKPAYGSGILCCNMEAADREMWRTRLFSVTRQFTVTVDGGIVAKYSQSAECLTSACPSKAAWSAGNKRQAYPCSARCSWRIWPSWRPPCPPTHHGGVKMAAMVPFGLVVDGFGAPGPGQRALLEPPSRARRCDGVSPRASPSAALSASLGHPVDP